MLTLCYTSMSLTVFHLLADPGLDGARMLALALPADAAAGLSQLSTGTSPLVVLAILFLSSARSPSDC